MKNIISAARPLSLVFVALCWLVFTGCEYDAPVTAKPTRKIEEKLVGDWLEKDGADKKIMKVRKLDDYIYIIDYEDTLYRAYHSDAAKLPLVSAQDIEDKRKYTLMTWKLSEDGKTLTVRTINEKVIPYSTKDSAAIQKLIEANAQNPDLFEKEAGEFVRSK